MCCGVLPALQGGRAQRSQVAAAPAEPIGPAIRSARFARWRRAFGQRCGGSLPSRLAAARCNPAAPGPSRCYGPADAPRLPSRLQCWISSALVAAQGFGPVFQHLPRVIDASIRKRSRSAVAKPLGVVTLVTLGAEWRRCR